MPMYVIRSCPSCNNVLETSSDYHALGKPYRVCQQCRALIRLDHITEWELKDSLEKLTYIGEIAIAALVIGIAGGIITLICLNFFVKLLYMNSIDLTPLYLWALFGIIISFGVFALRLRKEIQDSKNRMKNLNYREELTKIGIL